MMLELLLFLCSTIFLPAAYSHGVTLNAEVEAKTKYVWRAIYVGPEPFVFQPSATVSVDDLSFELWTNMDTDPARATVNEIDYILSYNINLGSFGIEPAFIYYAYPVVFPNSAEISLKLYYSFNNNFILYNTHYLSILGRNEHQNDAYYMDLGIEYSKQLLASLIVDANLSFAFASSRFNMDNANVDKNGLDNMIIDVQLPYYVTKHFYLRPRMTFSTLLMGALREALRPKQRTTNFVFSFAIGTDL